MQPAAADQVQYATLGWRAAAVIVDTLIVLVVSSIAIAALMAAGVVDLGISQAATLQDVFTASRAAPGWLMPVEYALFFVYFTLFELFGTTPGKRLFRMAVLRDDGTRATPTAVVVRNLIRIPEMILYYIPSAVSCLASTRRKRLGDFAARTVVMLMSSRGTVSSISVSEPGRRIDTLTVVPFGPRILSETWRVVQPFALSVPTLAMTSPRRMPAL